MEFSPEGGKQVVKETVFQLISHNQHLETLTREISDEYKQGSNKFSSISELCCLSILKNQSLLLGTGLGTGLGGYSSEQCVSFLPFIVKNNKGPLLTESEKDEVNSVVRVLKTLMVEGSLDKNQFIAALMQHSYLPLELAWILAKEGIIHIEDYVFKECSSARFLALFKSQLKHLSFDSGFSSTAVQCLAGVLTELIEIVFTERKGKSVSGDLISSLTSVLDGLILDLVDLLVEKQDEDRNFTKAFTKLDNSVVTLKKASSHFLSVMLSHKPITKVSNAIQQQANWCYGKVSPALLDWYKQILLPFSTEEILENLQRILEHQEVNWQLLLSFVSTINVCLTDAQKPFLDFVDKLFQEGLENSDMESLITGMLLIRQACFHGPHVFMSYSDWFQRTFSESSRSLANTRKSFSFFLKFLTDIVPYEDAPHLKVHILRPPFVPPKCREQLADYILLAKTRLADLKESIEAQVQEEQKSVDESKQQEELQAEVENTVHAFELSGKIPSSLMEASIFKKPYYIGRFLPALLKPRMLPSVPDAKMRLVEALKKAEKIPPSMYTNYEKACKKETLKLTEGLFIDLDSDDDLELSPMELLVNSLSQFHQGVQYLCGIIQEAPKLNVREAVSMICEKIESLLGISPSHQVTREVSIILDTDSLGLPQKHLEVIDALLNSITKSVHSVYTSTNPDFTWLSVLLNGLTQYSPVVKDMFRRIWVLIFTQEENLENHHIDSLAAILVELQKLGDSLPLVQLSGRSQLSLATRSFTEHVYQMLPVSSGKTMAFTLRLTASYMKYLVSSEEHLQVSSVFTVPPQVVKKLMYTVTRLIPEVRLEGRGSEAEIKETQFVVSLYRSVIFQDLLHKIQFTFSDWLNYEISVDTDQDVFSYLERYEYYSWTVYQYFLPLRVGQGGFAGDFKLAASQILQVILVSDLRCRDREPSCSGCKNKVLERSTSRNHMIGLLQELTRMFQLSDTNGCDRLPWLPSQLVSLCEDISSDIQRQASVISFFRIALCLPSYLLFCDHPQSQHLVETRKIAEFFRKFLVEYVVTDGVYLPLSLTLYIVQGLRLSCLARDAAEVLDSLCETSPVIALSILVHHKHLDYFLEYTSTRKPVVREIIDHFRDSRQSELMSHDWMTGAMLFSLFLDCRYEMLSTSLQVLSCGKLDKAIAVLTQLIVLYWTSLQLSPHHQVVSENLPVLIGKLLQSTAGKTVVGALLDGSTDSMSSQCVKKSVLKFRPVAVMRLLTTAPLKSLVKIYSSYCGGILNSFIEVGHVFEQICPGGSSPGEIQQAVTLEELMLFNKFLKDVISVTSKTILRDISQDVFLRCGSDVVLHVQRCLS